MSKGAHRRQWRPRDGGEDGSTAETATRRRAERNGQRRHERKVRRAESMGRWREERGGGVRRGEGRRRDVEEGQQITDSFPLKNKRIAIPRAV